MLPKIIFGLFVLALLQCYSSAPTDDDGTRIVGGYRIKIEKRPYLVQLHREKAFICGGAIISPLHILTAAHCIYGFDADKFEVVANATLIDGKNGVRRQVIYYSHPESYDPSENRTSNDIAILRLEKPLKGVNVKTIELCSKPIPPRYPVTVSGWGRTAFEGNVSTHLRTVDIKLVSYQKCKETYEKHHYVFNDKIFCAQKQSKDSCSGDSGGPLVFNNKVCGVVSYGHECALSQFPGVYTRVDKFLPFIAKTLKTFKTFFKTYKGGKYAG